MLPLRRIVHHCIPLTSLALIALSTAAEAASLNAAVPEDAPPGTAVCVVGSNVFSGAAWGSPAPLRYPAAMANPPTYARGAVNAPSQIAGSLVIGKDDPAFRYGSAVWVQPTPYPHNLFNVPTKNGDWAKTSIAGTIEFMCDGSAFEIVELGVWTTWRLAVDDLYVTAGFQTASTNDGSGYLRLIDFGSRGMRRIRLEKPKNGHTLCCA